MTPHALIAPARLAGIPLLRTQTDERLVDLVRAGNDAAFEAIVARYRRPLLRYCTKLLPEERAEDAVQQAFLRAYDSLRASRSEMHLRPWLYRIAHNTALNTLRDGGAGHEQLSEQIDGVERPDQAYEQRQRLREVVAAVELLPGRQRDAIVLRELEGRSYEEIAASLGVSDGAVRQLLNRARTTLRAGATALTPIGVLARAPWVAGSGDGMAARVAEVSVAGTGGAVLTKVCATALVTGAVFGGVATAPDEGEESRARPAPDRGAAAAISVGGAVGEFLDRRAARGGHRGDGSGGRSRTSDGERSGRRDGGDDRVSSGPGSGTGDELGSNSGPGSNSGSGSDSSGSGSSGSGSSGSGSSGSGSSGSRSGISGSGSSGSGSRSGSSGSGSWGTSGSDLGGSGSGSTSSGSGSSGSGSGSGSSGSGAPDEPLDSVGG